VAGDDMDNFGGAHGAKARGGRGEGYLFGQRWSS
jgi:hypothetical protein